MPSYILKTFLFAILLLGCSFDSVEEKKEQTHQEELGYNQDGDRVAAAELRCGERLRGSLLEENLYSDRLSIYLRAFKEEGALEIWAKNTEDDAYTLFRTYEICSKSGDLGPKRKAGDKQVPEGFYHIDRFNPKSRFHLSLGINYPNTSDRILSNANDLGGDIFIHGDCITIGCLPMTYEKIEEIYLLAEWAKASGQKAIPISIFPMRLSSDAFLKLTKSFSEEVEWIGLWEDLKSAYDLFNKSQKLPSLRFLKNGRHLVEP